MSLVPVTTPIVSFQQENKTTRSGGTSRLAGTVLFHLNINYSAVEIAEREAVVRRCYWPLLELCDRLPWLVLALEASAYTLEIVDEIDPAWGERLRKLVSDGRIEFVGAGDTQLIGPLVPGSVNHWNQALGQASYKERVGLHPTTALVGEMAWSQGIVDAYVDAGYRTLLMEWNNPRRQHPDWDDEWRYRLAWSASPTGQRAAVCWVDAVAFQKFQRAVVGDLELDEYVDWVFSHQGAEPRHLFIYASDAEIFDYRPGRFGCEPPLEEEASEWSRIETMLVRLQDRGLLFTTPERVACDPSFRPEVSLVLGTAADPIPVKKQPKYNVTRWGLSGHDDVGLNARCHRRTRELERIGGTSEEWRELCRAWASDHRTHLTSARWNSLPVADVTRGRDPGGTGEPGGQLAIAVTRRVGNRLRVETDELLAELDTRRGLAISFLRFKGVSERALIGTLRHGYFDDIDWAADFYSGNTVLEIPASPRVTDLERVEPIIEHFPDRIEVSAQVSTVLGMLEKRLIFHADHLELFYGLAALGERPVASLRTGVLTLLAENFGPDLVVESAHGGTPERFPLDGDCDHGRGVSSLVSARAAFGATDGRIAIDDGSVRLVASWSPEAASALPLLTAKWVEGKRFVRVAFSLSEIDETHRPGASLHDFRLTLRAERMAA